MSISGPLLNFKLTVMTRKVEPKLSQDKMFIKHFTSYDFTNSAVGGGAGQHVLEIHYTNGSKDVFTTKSTNPN